ncbi:MAG: hypothetical protein ACPGQS_00435 [Bradymonadia bacterium]
MGDDKDKIDESPATEQDVAVEESEPQGFEDELFTSAEYNFRHLTDRPEPGPVEAKENSEPPVVAQSSPQQDTNTPPSNDSAWTEADTSAPPAILPPVQVSTPPGAATEEQTTAPATSSSDETSSAETAAMDAESTENEAKAELPGKDTQSVVIDMGQLNEDAERKAEERAAQRAAFAPLESSGAMERITFSNLAALNFPNEDEESEDSEDGSTVNLHRQDFAMPTQSTADTSFDVENQTFDADDHPEQTLRRPGRWLFLVILAVVICVVSALGYAVWNLGEHRMLLTKKPIEAIEMGLGLREFPRPIVVPPPPPPQVNKITGRLEIENVQLDWANDKQSVMVSGRLKNGSNVDHERIELTVQLFDELRKSLIVKKIKCCRIESLQTDSTKKEATDALPTTPSETKVPPFHVIKSGTEKPFSASIKIKKPRRGEVSVKASVSYSEIIE